MSDTIINQPAQEPVIADTKPVVMELEPGKYHWCTCGRSTNQPFCNGAIL